MKAKKTYKDKNNEYERKQFLLKLICDIQIIFGVILVVLTSLVKWDYLWICVSVTPVPIYIYFKAIKKIDRNEIKRNHGD